MPRYLVYGSMEGYDALDEDDSPQLIHAANPKDAIKESFAYYGDDELKSWATVEVPDENVRRFTLDFKPQIKEVKA